MKTNTEAPNMTVGRAALLGLMKLYLEPLLDDCVTLLEIHKLMYFMQEAGEPLRLNYIKGKYGPYAKNLHHVLERIEGHYIVGYGDGAEAPGKTIEYKSDAIQKAMQFLDSKPETKKRFNSIEKLIYGFETPYGMELLSSVHWVAMQENKEAREDADAAIESVHDWSARKRDFFHKEHIRVAWKHLIDNGWL